MGYEGQAENLFIVQRDYRHYKMSGGASGRAACEARRGASSGRARNDIHRSTGMVFSVQMTPDAVGEESEGSGGSYSPR
jgi:hypothetical protein